MNNDWTLTFAASNVALIYQATKRFLHLENNHKNSHLKTALESIHCPVTPYGFFKLRVSCWGGCMWRFHSKSNFKYTAQLLLSRLVLCLFSCPLARTSWDSLGDGPFSFCCHLFWVVMIPPPPSPVTNMHFIFLATVIDSDMNMWPEQIMSSKSWDFFWCYWERGTLFLWQMLNYEDMNLIF